MVDLTFSKELFNTLDLMRERVVNNNAQLINNTSHIEISARNSELFSSLYSKVLKPNEIELKLYDSMKHDVYGNDLKVPYKIGLFRFEMKTLEKMRTDYSRFDAKEFWSYLHYEWKFCDVISHANGNSLEAYDKIKGALYDAFIKNHLNAKSLKGKKVLEIGPGYGLFPRLANKHGINVDYWCLDIVKRFEHKNFVVGNGTEFPKSINEKFDLIFMLDSYSHIPYETMENYLVATLTMLSDNGVIILNTPRSDKYCIFFGTVTVPLSFDRMREIVEVAGFEINKEKFYITEKFTESDIITIRRLKTDKK